MVVHRAAPEPFQQAAMLALGFCNSESVGMLVEEMQPLMDDYSSTRTSVSAQALEVTSQHLHTTLRAIWLFPTYPLFQTQLGCMW